MLLGFLHRKVFLEVLGYSFVHLLRILGKLVDAGELLNLQVGIGTYLNKFALKEVGFVPDQLYFGKENTITIANK